MLPHYDWKRYWCPREGEFSLDLEGYLYDPETFLGGAHNSTLKTLANIDDIACLVLLGESGIGKSETMRAERATLEAEITARGDAITWVDLLAIGSAEQFERDVLQPLRATQVAAGHYHYLFLDGLDESLLRLLAIKKMLITALQAIPVGQVRLRIACRTAEWPNSLENDLRKVFGEEQVAVYELVPLRKKDVAAASNAEGLDAADVLQTIDAAGAVPFAIKPITLKFLLNRLTRGGGISTSRAELYEEGCLQLADESEYRQESGLAGSLTSDQRLALARRVAALTILTNRRQLFFGKDEGDTTDADLLLRDIADGERERVKSLDVPATPEGVQETLKTALFSSRGPKRLGWSHQSYAEYLAATYLKAHNLAWVQVRSLFLDPSDGDVFPQLRGVAAWFAALDREAFDALVAIDPLILLTSDAVTLNSADRETMTGELLRLAASGRMGRIDPLRARVLQHLAHDTLAAELRPVIEDRSRPEFERELALDIAFHAQATALAPTLIAVALDPDESLLIRTQAACFASRIGADTHVLTALKPLLSVDPAVDKVDQLRGCTLEALWPTGALTMEELLPALLPPQRTNTHGTYQAFLESHPFASIDHGALVRALEWLLTYEASGTLPSAFQTLSNDLVKRAWEVTDDPQVRRLLADIALARYRRFDSLVDGDEAKEFAKVIAREHERRRVLADELLRRATHGG